MSIDLNILSNELKADSMAIGYANSFQNAADQKTADLLNSLTGPGAATVYRNDIKTAEIINAIVATDFAALTSLKIQQLNLILQSGILDATVSNTRTIFTNIFTGMTATLSSLSTLAQRTGSRAEVLFGTGTFILPSQIAAVRS